MANTSIPKLSEKIGTQQAADSALRQLLTTVIKRSGKSRAQIAQEMSLCVEQRISKRMLDDWTADSKKPARFPAFLVQTLCEVTGDDELQRHVLGTRLRKLLELGQRQFESGELCAALLKTNGPERGKKGKAEAPQSGGRE